MGDTVEVVPAKTPLTTKSVTFVLAVVAVAVTVPVDVDAPVENPAVKVPLNLPKLAATALVSVTVADVAPEAMLAKAAATSLTVMFTLAVKVKPLTVTKSLGLSVLNEMTFVSFVPLAVVSPGAIVMVGLLTLDPVAAKSTTFELGVVDVNLTVFPDAGPVL